MEQYNHHFGVRKVRSSDSHRTQNGLNEFIGEMLKIEYIVEIILFLADQVSLIYLLELSYVRKFLRRVIRK